MPHELSEERQKTPRILVVEDEAQMRRLLRHTLEVSGYEVFEAATGEEAVLQAVQCQPEMVVLDLGLPDIDGAVVLSRLREWSEAPVIVVSARHGENDKIAALDAGANDYITKPFGTGELLARLRAMQRYMPPETKPKICQFGDLTVDVPARMVKLRGQPVKLSATEYSLLLLFVQNAGRVLTQTHILREIWGSDSKEKTGALRVYIQYLRNKLEANPDQPCLLITEPGVGYRLNA